MSSLSLFPTGTLGNSTGLGGGVQTSTQPTSSPAGGIGSLFNSAIGAAGNFYQQNGIGGNGGVSPASSKPLVYAPTTTPTATTPITSEQTPQNQSIVPPPPAYDTTTGALTDYGKSVGMPDVAALRNQQVTSINPQNYNINPGSTIPSSSLNSGMTMSDAMSALNKNQNGLFNGSADGKVVPSDSLYGQVVNGIYNASQYSPQEQQALGQYNNTQNTILQTQLAARRQLQQLQDNGTFTADQSAPILSELNRRSQAQLADLATQQSGNTLSLQTLGMLRQNQLGAYQNIAQFLQPTQVAPGSTLYNPLTGPQYQGSGASPQTIFQTAQQLEQSAQQQGTLQYNTDGTVNHQTYIQQAQDYYGTHNMLGGNGGGAQSGGYPGSQGGYGSSPSQAQISLPQNQDGTYQTANGGSVSPVYAQKISSLPSQYQSYVLPGPQGVAYIDASRLSQLPTNVQYQIQSKAAAAGIPWLDSTQSLGLQSVQSLYDTLDATQLLVNKALQSGVGGGVIDAARTKLNDIFQTEPLLQGFKSLRTQAGAADTSLMGGIGSGFRQNTANLQLSIQNFPTSSDNLETANAKIADIKYLLDTSLQKTFPGVQTGSSLVNTGKATGGSQGSQSAGGGGWASLGG